MTTDPTYLAAIDDWHSARLKGLTADYGWLNVIGRFWLEPGSATVGSAEDSDIVLPSGPAHIGTITQDSTGGVTFAPADTAPITLALDPEHPPRFTAGGIFFEVTTFNGRNALRARDNAAPALRDFTGLKFFPTDPAWRITADWVALDQPEQVEIDTVHGIPTTVTITHKAVFTHDGATYELIPHGIEAVPMFVIRDLTSRSETYGASRFLYGEDITATSIVLDFNKAFNPPCAFTIHAVCPLPPPGNILPFRVGAGELAP